MYVTPISPVITAALLLHETPFLFVPPMLLHFEVLLDYFGLHIDGKCLCLNVMLVLLLEKRFKQSLVSGRGLTAFFEHNIIELSAYLISALP